MEPELTPLIWERDGDKRHAMDGDSGYYSVTPTEGEGPFGKSYPFLKYHPFLLQFTPREEYDKPNPQRRRVSLHMTLETIERSAEEDRLYRIQAAERAERAAKCTIKTPTLSWTPCADGSFISDPPGYTVRKPVHREPQWSPKGWELEHDGRAIGYCGSIEAAQKMAQGCAYDAAIEDHFNGVADIVDEFVSQDSGDTRILRTLAAYRLMRVAGADLYINTGPFAIKVGNGERDIIFLPEHCWLEMGHLMLDCTPPTFPELGPHANWELKRGWRIVCNSQYLQYRLEPEGDLESPPWLGEFWEPYGGVSPGFTQKIQKVQMLEGGRILAETERLRALAVERQGLPYCRDDTVYPLRFER